MLRIGRAAGRPNDKTTDSRAERMKKKQQQKQRKKQEKEESKGMPTNAIYTVPSNKLSQYRTNNTNGNINVKARRTPSVPLYAVSDSRFQWEFKEIYQIYIYP